MVVKDISPISFFIFFTQSYDYSPTDIIVEQTLDSRDSEE